LPLGSDRSEHNPFVGQGKKNESDTQAGISRQAIQSKASKLEKGTLSWLMANYF
jgi:hypothetical protein